MGLGRHDPNKIPLGASQSSDRLATNEKGDPATFLAGLAVRLASSGELSLASGRLLGVSLGRPLCFDPDMPRTAVMRAGNRVPLRLTDIGVAASLVRGDLTFTAKNKGTAGNAITIALVAGGTAGSEVVSVVGNAISISIASGVSTATQIKAAVDASPAALALIGVAITGTAGAAQSAAVAAPLASGVESFAWVVKGARVSVDNTGKAINTGGTATGAVFLTGPMKGINLDETEVDVALIDMGGGL